MTIAELPAISRPKTGQTWHQEKRSTTIAGPWQKDLRRNSRNYCPKPAKRCPHVAEEGTAGGGNYYLSEPELPLPGPTSPCCAR
jgi:hypothetical protein